MSDDVCRKHRVALIRHWLTIGKVFHNVGKHEQQLLDQQEQIDNCKIVRQYHVENLGFIVDGYCPETNTVYEVYEPRHFQHAHMVKDLQRQNAIEQSMKCNFKIIKDERVTR